MIRDNRIVEKMRFPCAVALIVDSTRNKLNFEAVMENKNMVEIIEATSRDLPLIRRLAEQTFHVTYLPLQPKEKVDYLFGLMYNPASLSEQMKNGQRFILVKDETGYQGYASYEINCKKIGLTKIHKIYVLPTE